MNNDATNPFAPYVGSIGILTTPAQQSTIATVQVFVRNGISLTIPAFLEKDQSPVAPGSAVRISGLSGNSGVTIINL